MTIKNKIGYFIVVTLSAVIGTNATAQKQYSLEEMVRMGFKNSHQIKINQSENTVNQLALQEARLAYTPNISVSGQAIALNSPDVRFMGQTSNVTAPKSAAFVMGSVSIPVFNGFQLKNNLNLNKELIEAGVGTEQIDSLVTALQVIDAYMNLYKAQQSKKLIENNISSANKRVSDFKKLQENGLLTQNDFLKAQLSVSQLELSMEDAKNQEQIAQINLALLTGLDENTTLIADSTILNKIPIISKEINNEEIMLNRKDVESINHQIKAAEYAVKIQKSSYYPHVNLSGTYLSLNTPNLLTVKNVLNAGVSVSFDLSSFYKNNPVVSRKQEQVLQMNERKGILTDKIKMESTKGYLDYKNTVAKTRLYEKIEGQATENFRSIESKFSNNLATTNDLLEAEVQLLQSKINNQLAKADVFLAYCNYLKVSGDLNQLRSL